MGLNKGPIWIAGLDNLKGLDEIRTRARMDGPILWEGRSKLYKAKPMGLDD